MVCSLFPAKEIDEPRYLIIDKIGNKQYIPPSSRRNIKGLSGISFEEIVLNIRLGNEIDIFNHPNQDRYPGQKISVVMIDEYAYLVPFVENDKEIFLKTIIPSRKATKRYTGGSYERT